MSNPYAQQPGLPADVNSKKILCGVLGILFGGLGIHRFILGDTSGGIIRIVITLLTCGLGSIIGLIEGIIAESEDETLMDRYLAGEHIDHDTLISDLEMAVARGSFYPVIATAVEVGGLGTTEVLDLVRRGFPSPLEHPLPPASTPDGPTTAADALATGQSPMRSRADITDNLSR